MGKNNVELLKFAESFLGKGGSTFRAFCGLGSGQPWCCAYVRYIFSKGGDGNLFYGNKNVTYCPSALTWCRTNLAQIPIYIALPSDIIFFDWQPNNVPDHIGFVRERKSDQEVYTLEGNTSGGIVAKKTRPNKYVIGCFRPHFKPTAFSATKKLDVDGYFGYNSIAVMQRWLGVTQDAILGKGTVKALQKKLGVTQDGSWGKNTSKALQKLIGTTVDGAFGAKSVKALQTYLNKVVFTATASTPSTSIIDKELSACKVQAEWMKNYTYTWGKWKPRNVEMSKKYGTCVTYVACVLQRIGVLKSGEFIWHNNKGKVYGHNSKMTVTYPNGTLKSNKSKLKRGDIVMVGDKTDVGEGGNSHIFILNGTWSGDSPYIWDNQSASRVKKGKNGLHTYGGGKKIIAVIRLK